MSEDSTKTGNDELNRQEILATRESMEYAQEEVKRFIKNLGQIKKNYPEVYKQIIEDHPEIEGTLNQLLYTIEATNVLNMSYEQMEEFRNKYNQSIRPIEDYFKNIRLAAGGESLQESILRMGKEKLSPAAEAELQKYMGMIWDEIFPPSKLKEAVIAFNGRNESDGQAALETWQEYALVPGMAIEQGVNFFISLKDEKTWTEMKTGFDSLRNMSYEDFVDIMEFLKYSYENSSRDEISTNGMTLLLSILFIGGGIGKIGSLLKKMGAPKHILVLAEKAGHKSAALIRARKYANAIPVVTLNGMMLSKI